jgi:hypothetical protein
MGEGVTRWELRKGESQISNVLILRIIQLLDMRELPRSLPHEWVTAVRRVVNRVSRKPARPRASHAQPP